jgi:hypothetical protein
MPLLLSVRYLEIYYDFSQSFQTNAGKEEKVKVMPALN